MSARAVILAGGKGSRLSPYTTVIPKPLLPVGDRAILEILMRQLRQQGFTDVTLAVGYLAHLIRAIMNSGAAHGVEIDYHEEATPLGTAGPLADIDGLRDEPFLVMNGDVLTTMSFRALYQAHLASGNALTIATHRRVVETEYGVIRVDDRDIANVQPVTGYDEKPTFPMLVSMGVYVISPEALEYIPEGARFDIPDLVLALLAAGQPVGSWLYEGYWLDIGRHDDYARAIEDFERIEAILLGAEGADEAPVRTP